MVARQNNQNNIEADPADMPVAKKMVELAEFSANVLSASKHLQILQNGSTLKFIEKAPQRMILRLSNRSGVR